MKKTLWASLAFVFSNVARNWMSSQRSPMVLSKLKLSIWFLQGIKTTRFLFMGLLGLGACLMFLMAGLILFHVAILVYAPWSNEAKMWFTCICSLIYVGGAFGVFAYVLDEDKWMRIFNADKIVDEVLRASESDEDEKEQVGTNGHGGV